MAVQFNIDSRHIEDASFKKVLFGYDGKLLEVELNELQDIMNSKRAQMVDKVFGSRPLYVGTYTLSAGTLSIANEVAVIGREIVMIPSASITAAAGDTIYLNVQEKTITQSDTVRKFGKVGGSDVVSNYLQDSRLGEESTRRVQVTYQLTKSNVGNGVFLKLCSISASGTVTKSTADYPDSDLYKEVRRLASEVIDTRQVFEGIAAAQKNAIDFAKGFGLGVEAKLVTGDMNAINETGFYRGNSLTNAPDNQWHYIINIKSSDTAQLQIAVNNITGAMHLRQKSSGTWGAWTTQETTAGAQSKVNSAMDAHKASTTDHANATTTANGFMSSADKTKLNGVATGAEVNQNAFNTIKVGATNVVADSKTDTLEIVGGTGINVTPDATNDKLTFAVDSTIETTSGAQTKATAAEAAAVAWAKQFGLGTVTANINTDLNDIALTGFYYANSTATNKAVTTNGWVISIHLSGSYATQFYVPNNKAVMYHRNMIAGVWSAWEELETVAGSAAKVKVVQDDLTAHKGSRGSAHAVATSSEAGFMSSTDKSKLDGVAANANNYSHPSTHPASIIVQDASNRFVSDTEKATWNAKASTAVATTSANGLMSSGDKSKLDGIAAGAEVNQNAFATVKVGATNVAADSKADTLEIVGGTGINVTPDATNDKLTFAVDSTIETTTGAQSKADAAQTAAQNFTKGYNMVNISDTRSDNQSPEWYQTGDTARKLVSEFKGVSTMGLTGVSGSYCTVLTDTRWSGSSGGKVTQLVFTDDDNMYTRTGSGTTWGAWKKVAFTDRATASADGLMSSTDKSKLDGVATGANNYSHPSTHPATMITEDASHRFITDAERTKWNDASELATTSANGLMSSADKTKLNGIATGAEVNQNTFATVSAGGTSLVADSKSDTLTVTGGTGINVTGNATSDTMTIAVDSTIETTSGAQTKATQALNDAKAYAMNMVSSGSTTDPNTTQEALILTNHANCPNADLGGTSYWHILTTFYSTKTGNRAQLALSYNGTSRIAFRQCYNSVWSSWIQAETTDGAQAKADAVKSTLEGRTITAGTGLTGGGSLAANRTINFDTTWGDARYLNKAGDTMSGNLTLSGGTNARLYLDANRTNKSYIMWNATASVDYGMVFNVDGESILNLRAGVSVSEMVGTFNVTGSIREAGTALSDKYVITGRSITAGTGLTGGGTLSTSRTLHFDTLWGDNRYVTHEGNNLINGNLKLSTTGEGLSLTAPSSTDTTFLTFSSGGTRRGYVGKSQSVNDIWMYSDSGRVVLSASTGIVLDSRTVGTTPNVHINGNSAMFRLVGTDHGYMEYHVKGSTTNRSGFIGFGSAQNNYMTLNNEIGPLELKGFNGNAYLNISEDATSGVVFSKTIYDRTYGYAANVYITSAGTLGRSTSASKYKLDIRDQSEEKMEGILNLRPRTWFDKTASEVYAELLTKEAAGEKVDWDKEDIPVIERIPGLIAEEVIEAGFPEYVIYGEPDENGNREVEGLMYDRLWVPLVPKIKKQQEIIEAQEDRIASLEERLAKLEALLG